MGLYTHMHARMHAMHMRVWILFLKVCPLQFPHCDGLNVLSPPNSYIEALPPVQWYCKYGFGEEISIR